MDDMWNEMKMEERILFDRQKTLSKIAFISSLSYVLFGIVAPAILFMVSDYRTSFNGAETIDFIRANRSWWVTIQSLTLGPSVFLAVSLLGMHGLSRRGNSVFADIGLVLGLLSQALFLAYFPVVFGLDEIAKASIGADAARRAALEAAAEALCAQNNAYGPSEAVLGLGLLFSGLGMPRTSRQGWFRVLTVATGCVACVGGALKEVLGVAYLWWWAVFLAWIISLAILLIRHGRPAPRT